MPIIQPSVPVKESIIRNIHQVLDDGAVLPVRLSSPFIDDVGHEFGSLTIVDECRELCLVSCDDRGDIILYTGLEAMSPVFLYKVYRDVVLERCRMLDLRKGYDPDEVKDLVRRSVELATVSETAVARKYLFEVFSDDRHSFLRFDANYTECPYVIAWDHFLGNTVEGIEGFDEVSCETLPDGRLLLNLSMLGQKAYCRLVVSASDLGTYDPYWELPKEAVIALEEAVYHSVCVQDYVEDQVKEAIDGYGVTLDDDDAVLRHNGINRLTDLRDYPEGEGPTDASSDQYFLACKDGVRFIVLVHYGQWAPYGFTYRKLEEE